MTNTDYWQPRVIEVELDEGAIQTDHHFDRGELLLLSLPCPGRRMRGGVGGAMMTACAFCGEVMASTAGPHSRDGRMFKPVLSDGSGNGWLSWLPYRPCAQG